MFSNLNNFHCFPVSYFICRMSIGGNFVVTQYSSLIISIQKFLPVRYPKSTTTGTLEFLENRIERKLDYCYGRTGCPLKILDEKETEERLI